MLSNIFKQLSIIYKYNKTFSSLKRRCLHVSSVKSQDSSKEIVVHGSFEDIQDKNKNTYLDMIRIFINQDHVYRRGHVEFIYAALKNMESFGVHKDLEVYKSLIDILPKGKFVAKNMLQVEFMHYPKQQQCVIDLLEQMEDNGVMPDYEMEDMLVNIFGRKAYPLRKFWRIMYWMPKFKNLSPWPVPNPLPDSVFEIAKIAIERISSVDKQSEVKVYDTKDIQDSIDDTWIVSAQSPNQKKLVREHDKKSPIYVEGAFKVYIKHLSVNYFILRANPKPIKKVVEDLDDVSNIRIPFFKFDKFPGEKFLKTVPSVHEQDDGVIFAVCATGTSSKDSLLSWIRHLERDGNTRLSEFSVVFTLKSGSREIANVGEVEESSRIEDK